MNVDALFSLAERTVLLTGASGFFGRTISRALCEAGARVLLLGRSEKLDDLTAGLARDFGEKAVQAYKIDMHDTVALQSLLERIVQTEEVDVLINNAHEMSNRAGFNVPNARLEDAPLDQLMKNVSGGIVWPFLTTQIIGRSMWGRGGSIVNIASMYAIVAPDPTLYEGTDFMNPPGYSASKAAMMGLTRYTASFWAAKNVRANALLPGPFSNTENTGENSVKSTDPFLDRLRARTCLRRIGNPKELVGSVLFLSSDASSYMTGQTVVVDGGWTIL